jgi:uncharacterized lipoprotein YajG
MKKITIKLTLMLTAMLMISACSMTPKEVELSERIDAAEKDAQLIKRVCTGWAIAYKDRGEDPLVGYGDCLKSIMKYRSDVEKN